MKRRQEKAHEYSIHILDDLLAAADDEMKAAEKEGRTPQIDDLARAARMIGERIEAQAPGSVHAREIAFRELLRQVEENLGHDCRSSMDNQGLCHTCGRRP